MLESFVSRVSGVDPYAKLGGLYCLLVGGLIASALFVSSENPALVFLYSVCLLGTGCFGFWLLDAFFSEGARTGGLASATAVHLLQEIQHELACASEPELSKELQILGEALQHTAATHVEALPSENGANGAGEVEPSSDG